MKIRFVLFPVIAAILLTVFGAAAFAENPYQDCFYEIPSVGIIDVQKHGTEVMSSPDKDSEAIGSLDAGTIFRILGRYNRQWYVVDLTLYDGFEAEYGFIKTVRMVENPSWLMTANRKPRVKENTWPVSSSSYEVGLAPVLEESDEAYRSITRARASYYTVIKEGLKRISEEGQELYLIPFETPLFNDLREETGIIPGFTLAEVTGEMTDGYIPIKANPGKEDEFSGWIMNQTLLRILN